MLFQAGRHTYTSSCSSGSAGSSSSSSSPPYLTTGPLYDTNFLFTSLINESQSCLIFSRDILLEVRRSSARFWDIRPLKRLSVQYWELQSHRSSTGFGIIHDSRSAVENHPRQLTRLRYPKSIRQSPVHDHPQQCPARSNQPHTCISRDTDPEPQTAGHDQRSRSRA